MVGAVLCSFVLVVVAWLLAVLQSYLSRVDHHLVVDEVESCS